MGCGISNIANLTNLQNAVEMTLYGLCHMPMPISVVVFFYSQKQKFGHERNIEIYISNTHQLQSLTRKVIVAIA